MNQSGDLFTAYQLALNWVKKNSLRGEGIITTSKKRSAYPEVTGYFIPTLLASGEKSLATKYVEYLAKTQKNNGSFCGPDGSEVIFDTGQALRGFVEIARISNREFLGCAQRSADYILSKMDRRGRLRGTYSTNVPELIHTYVLPPLLHLYRLTGVKKYQEGALKSANYYACRVKTLDKNILIHFAAYVIDGLIETGRETEVREWYQELLNSIESNGSIPAYPNVKWICSTGVAQMAVIAFKTGNTKKGCSLVKYMSKIQNNSGGYFGSYGGGASYFPSEEISWANKYFLDACHLMVKTHFEEESKVFPDDVANNDDRLKKVIKLIGKNFDGKLLDLGCGKGRFLKRLNKRFRRATLYGTDISNNQLKYVPRKFHTKEGSLVNIPYRDSYFDRVICVEALEHSLNPIRSIEEMCRVVRPGGKIIVIDKNAQSMSNLKMGDFETWFEENELRQMVETYLPEATLQKFDLKGYKKNGLFFIIDASKPDENDLVSIVLPTKNGDRYIRESIDSCLRQTYRKLELIVIDDGSTDSTDKAIREFKDKRIKSFKNRNSLGLPRSLNIGFNIAKGKYLTWTSDDNIFLPSAISSMVSQIEKTRSDFVYTDYYHFSDDDTENKQLISLPDHFDPKKGNTIGACFLYSKKIAKKVGLYDPDTFLAEDYDYWIRMKNIGKLHHLKRPLYYYRSHPASLYRSNTSRVKIVAEMVRIRHGVDTQKKGSERIQQIISEQKFGKKLTPFLSWYIGLRYKEMITEATNGIKKKDFSITRRSIGLLEKLRLVAG